MSLDSDMTSGGRSPAFKASVGFGLDARSNVAVVVVGGATRSICRGRPIAPASPVWADDALRVDRLDRSGDESDTCGVAVTVGAETCSVHPGEPGVCAPLVDREGDICGVRD
jgi:hypothetical protein